MGLHVNANEVVAVLLSDGWHGVKPGTFAVGPFAFGSSMEGGSIDIAGQPGFRFTTQDGPVITGPLSSVLAVQSESTQVPGRTPLHELADRLDGSIVVVNGTDAVRFSYAGEDFEVWLGATKYGPRWLFAAAGNRDGAVDYGFGEKDPVDQVARAAMSDLKAGMRPGRTAAPGSPSATP
ncbi:MULTISPECIES: hypothetical protein [unclassified Kitasatospora]|uniref:hypothetical protein n=1 Tax=unclassified Kitasatospora TaxID=2633591 RepID=UPI002E340EE9|nr:hypothetical protein [Kitasatospora sp. NBC_01246]